MEPPSDVPTERPDTLSGTRVADRYDVHDLIGVGGTCEVYLATDTLLEIPVALKRVRPDYLHRAEFRKRMIKEARRGRIPDPRIAAIHEVVTWRDELMLVMEYVDGDSLAKRIEQGLPMTDFWRMAQECLEALRAAHAKGLIHRDIKPDNIMVTKEGGIKILDFGLAHRIPGMQADLGKSTVSIAVPAGTPRYMSPEAYRGADLDERADIFSLGVVFYQMLCGMPPFQARNWSDLNDEILHFDPPPPCDNRGVSKRLSRLVMKMMAKDPDDRYASCNEVISALKHARKGDIPVRPILYALLAVAVIGGATQVPKVIQAATEYFRPSIPIPTVAIVMPFEWLGGDETERATARGLGQLLSDELALHRDPRGFSIVHIRHSAEGPIRDIDDSREMLGANVALVGEIDQVGRSVRANLRVHRTDPQNTRIRSASITVASGQLRELARRCQTEIRELLDLPALDTERWDRIHGERSDGPFRLYLEGLAAVQIDSFAMARDAFTRATQIDPKYAAAHAALAQALVAEPNGRSATLVARDALRLDPVLPAAHLAMANIQELDGNTSGAIEMLSATIELEDAPLEAWVELIGLLGATDPAARDRVVQGAVDHWVGWSWPFKYRGYYSYHRGDIGSAIEDYGEAARLAPERCSAWSAYGGLLILEGRYAEGIQACEKALAVRRDDASFSNLATAYFNLSRFEEAAQVYQEALQAGDSDYRMWLNLGDAYSRFDADQARGAYAQATRLLLELEDPDAPSTVSDLARLYAIAGMEQEANEKLDQALRLSDLQAEHLESCALAAWELKRHELALSLLTRAIGAGLNPGWIRDSALYEDWRQDPGFAAVLKDGAI